MKLEGRVAGAWVAELRSLWNEKSGLLAQEKLAIDLRDVTYSDMAGTQALKEIYSQSHAELIAGNLWTQSLAEEIRRGNNESIDQELFDANHA